MLAVTRVQIGRGEQKLAKYKSPLKRDGKVGIVAADVS
jgi:hypothetical protein